MKSWKTTLAGGIVALGAYLQTVTDPGWVAAMGHIMVGSGGFLTGLFARDNGVTSEAAGAKPADSK